MLFLVNYVIGMVFSLKFCFLALVTYIVYKRLTMWRYNLPPRPMSYPIIGNMHHVFSKSEVLYRWCKRMEKEYGPVIRISLGPIDAVVLNDYDSANEAMVDKGNDFSGRMKSHILKIITDDYKDVALAAPDQPTFGVRRKLLATALKNFTIGKPYEARVGESLHRLFAHFDELARTGAAFHASEYCKLLSYNVTASMCFQKNYAFDDPEFKTMHQMFQAANDSFGNGITISDFIPFVEYLPFQLWDTKIALQIRNNLMNIINRELDASRRRGEETDEVGDLALYVLRTKEENKKQGLDQVSDLEIQHIIADVFGAGVDTTQITLRWLLLILAVHQNVQEKLYDEIQENFHEQGPLISVVDYKPKMPYSEAVLLETTRYGTVTVLGLPHATMCDTKVHGYDVPKGTPVFINQWAINHDEKNFARPEEFIPERFLGADGKVGPRPKGYLPFGLGRRSCPGETAARNTLWMTMVALVWRYRILPPDGVKLKAEYKHKSGFEGAPDDYQVVVQRR